jgi:hypothetical protein
VRRAGGQAVEEEQLLVRSERLFQTFLEVRRQFVGSHGVREPLPAIGLLVNARIRCAATSVRNLAVVEDMSDVRRFLSPVERSTRSP